MVLYECPGYLSVLYVEGGSYIAFCWDDFSIGLDELRLAHEAALSFAVERGCFRYVADCSQARDSLLPEVILWWRGEWVPRLVSAGVRRIVTVVPSSTLASLSNRDWQRDPEGRLEILNVGSRAEAIAALA
jgi:hypothetical protein